MITQREEFARAMLVWLNEEVAPKGVRVDADTPLFATRLLDSLKVLELIAFTEQAIGRPMHSKSIPSNWIAAELMLVMIASRSVVITPWSRLARTPPSSFIR